MRHRTGIFFWVVTTGLMVQVGAASMDVVTEAPRGRVYGRLERIGRIEYTESDPVRTAFDWGRLAATRWLVGFGVEPNGAWYGGGVAGLGVGEVHNGEGQTVEYDSVILGFEGMYRRSIPVVPGMGLVASARCLFQLSSDGRVRDVARDNLTDGGRTTLSWREWRLGVVGTLDYDVLRFEGGLEYCNQAIRQEWTFQDDRSASDSTLRPDRDVGVRLGGGWLVSDAMEILFDMTVGHETRFAGGVQYVF